MSPAIFHSARAPTLQADVADHFIKLLYYSSGPCGGPRCPFSEAIFYRDICMSTRVSPSEEFTARTRGSFFLNRRLFPPHRHQQPLHSHVTLNLPFLHPSPLIQVVSTKFNSTVPCSRSFKRILESATSPASRQCTRQWTFSYRGKTAKNCSTVFSGTRIHSRGSTDW